MFVPDLLHVADYSGITSHAVGNVLYEIVHDLEFRHTSQSATLAFLNADLQNYYTQNRIRDRTSMDSNIWFACRVSRPKSLHLHPPLA
jgi:hypothetical protein